MAKDKFMTFDNENKGICLRCGKMKAGINTKLIQHPQSSIEVEVCGDCYSEFITLNDNFFKDVE